MKVNLDGLDVFMTQKIFDLREPGSGSKHVYCAWVAEAADCHRCRCFLEINVHVKDGTIFRNWYWSNFLKTQKYLQWPKAIFKMFGVVMLASWTLLQSTFRQSKPNKSSWPMNYPTASGWGIWRYMPWVSPHPNPLPKERGLCGNPAASSGVLKTVISNTRFFLWWIGELGSWIGVCFWLFLDKVL